MKAVILLIGIVLSGCVANAENFYEDYHLRLQAEEQATLDADKEVGEVCANNKPPEKLPRNSFVKFTECANEIFAEYVVPTASYPDLFLKYRAKSLDTAQLYQDGSISFAQVKARGRVAWMEYVEERDAKAQSRFQHLEVMDAAERAQMQRAFQSMPRATSTSCSGYGGNMYCRSW